jgi:hypothetical protein
VLAEVLQDVHERVTNLARRRELPSVEAIHPNPTATPERTIDRLRDANREPLHAAPQLRVRVGLEQQMDVITLHAEVK